MIIPQLVIGTSSRTTKSKAGVIVPVVAAAAPFVSAAAKPHDVCAVVLVTYVIVLAIIARPFYRVPVLLV